MTIDELSTLRLGRFGLLGIGASTLGMGYSLIESGDTEIGGFYVAMGAIALTVRAMTSRKQTYLESKRDPHLRLALAKGREISGNDISNTLAHEIAGNFGNGFMSSMMGTLGVGFSVLLGSTSYDRALLSEAFYTDSSRDTISKVSSTVGNLVGVVGQTVVAAHYLF